MTRARRLGALAAAAVLLAPAAAAAQSINVDLGAVGEGGSVTGQVLRLVLLVTVLSLAP